MASNRATLRADIQNACDLTNTTSTTDAELNEEINRAIADLHSLITLANEDWLLSVDAGRTIAAGASTITLASSVQHIRRVVRTDGSEPYPVPSIGAQEAYDVGRLSFRAEGDTLYFYPTYDAPGTYSIYYIPDAQEFTGDGTALNHRYERFRRFIVLKGIVYVKGHKEQKMDEAAVAQAELQAMRGEIKSLLAKRHGDGPRQVPRLQDGGVLDAYWET